MTSPSASAIRSGDRRALAKAITLLEGALPEQRKAAQALLLEIAPYAGNSVRIAVSGVPGVGKSTFLEAWGKELLARGRRLAILAIDPSSPVSGGSILGDRTRMEELSRHPDVFIRPSPTSGALGGVARRTREAILACEAAGYDTVLVETVGVGQSEAVAAAMVDVFLVLQLPNAGDELQGIKRGILELADLLVVTKADGTQREAARQAKGQLQRALMLTRGQEAWQVPVLSCSSLENEGLAEVWQSVEQFLDHQKSGGFDTRRRDQALSWFRDELGEQLRERLESNTKHAAAVKAMETRVARGELPASAAAGQVLDTLLPVRNP